MFSSTSLWAYITLHAHSDIELVVSLYIVETTVYNARINNQRFSLFKAKRVLKCYFSNLLFIFRLKEHISDPSNNPILIFPEGNQWWQCTSHRWIQSISNMLESFLHKSTKDFNGLNLISRAALCSNFHWPRYCTTNQHGDTKKSCHCSYIHMCTCSMHQSLDGSQLNMKLVWCQNPLLHDYHLAFCIITPSMSFVQDPRKSSTAAAYACVQVFAQNGTHHLLTGRTLLLEPLKCQHLGSSC